MTSDDQQPDLEALRSRLAAAVPPAPSVAGWAERAAARARRRRARRRQALAVVSASCVAAAIAIAATSYGGNDNGDGPAPDANRASAIASTPQPPAGMRYVGINSVVVAVPADWELRTLGCENIAFENTVLIANVGWALCSPAEPLPEVSLLRILPTDSAKETGRLEDAQPAGEINGIPVLKAPAEAETEGVARVLVVPDADAVFWLDAPDADGIEQIFHTLTSLPDDYVALPSARMPWPCVRNRLEGAGMVVEIRREGEPELNGSGVIIDSKPMLGTVAKPGTTVTLTVPTGGPDKCLPPPISPGQ